MIIDCHLHWPGRKSSKPADGPAGLLADMDGYGIDKAVLMPMAGISRLDACREDNDRVARIAAKAPDRLFPLGTAWPGTERDGVEEVRRCLVDLNMNGLKFHPWLQGFSTADPFFAEMCALAGDLKAPVFFHDGTPCYCVSEQIAGLARRFPATTFVLGHSGLLWNWRSALEAARRPNVWLCMCGPHMRAVEIFCRRVDTDRLIWGSDYTGNAAAIAYRLELVQHARIDDATRQKMFGANAARLLRAHEDRIGPPVAPRLA